MASLSITLKSRFLLSPFPQQRRTHYPKPFFTYKPNTNSNPKPSLSERTCTTTKTKRVLAVLDERRGDSEEEKKSCRRIPFSEVEVVVEKKRAFWGRRWNKWDVIRASEIAWVHLLCLWAPFHFNFAALKVAVVMHLIAGFGITLSYHRNLAHRSFALPKWLEYLLALCGTLAGQGDPIEWVSHHRYHHQYCDTERDPHSPKDGFWFSHILWVFDTDYITEKCGDNSNVEDLKKQPFYRFLQRSWGWGNFAIAVILYLWGGLPFFLWGICVRKVLGFHGTFLVNSASHVWGKQVWNTKDLSKNNWWVAVVALGEGWHNNHHAFEYSARHGLEWWQFDVTWYIIRSLQAIGLAYDVKLPTEAHKQRMALD